MRYSLWNLSLVLIAAGSSSSRVESKQSLRRAQGNDEYRIVRTLAQLDDGSVEALWRAIPTASDYEHRSYVIDLDADKSFMNAYGDDLPKGNTCVILSGTNSDSDKSFFLTYSSISAKSCGTSVPVKTTNVVKEALVIRAYVNDTDSDSDSITPSELRSYIFGEGSTSLSSQVHQCSYSSLDIDPVRNEPNLVEKGILDVVLYNETADLNRTIVENMVASAAKDLLQESKLSEFDLVIMCLPETSEDWKSDGYLNGRRSLYSGRICKDVNHLMHNIGLNWGLYPELNQTGMMGPPEEDEPKMCYDLVNSWKLGWYKKLNRDVNPMNGPWGHRFVSLGNYYPDLANYNYTVVAKIKQSQFSDLDLYLGFNLEFHINKDTQDFQDSIVLMNRTVSVNETKVNTIWSISKDDIDDGVSSVYVIPDYGGPQQNLVIQVCGIVGGSNEAQIPEHARVVINLGKGASTVNYLTCAQLEQGEGIDLSLSSFSGTGSNLISDAIPVEFFNRCIDYSNVQFQYEGAKRSCNEFARGASGSLRQKICTETDAGVICRKTCDAYVECTEGSPPSSNQEGGPDLSTFQGGGGTSTTSDEDDDECADQKSDFTVDGVERTCNEFKKGTKNALDKRRQWCIDTDAGRACRETCLPYVRCNGRGGQLRSQSASSNPETDVSALSAFTGTQGANQNGCSDQNGVIPGTKGKTCATLRSYGKGKLKNLCTKKNDSRYRAKCRSTCHEWASSCGQ